MSTTPKLRVAIIGGGIAGIALATGLRNKCPHIDFRIYEAASVFSEIGAGLTVAGNAREAMRILGPSLYNAYDKHKTPNLWPDRINNYMLHRVGYGEDAGKFIASPQTKDGHQSVHRAKFLDDIVKGIPADRCSFSKRLVAIEQKNIRSAGQDDPEPIVLRFEDGTTETADAVIGTDGIHSFVRTYVLGAEHPAAKPVFAGSVAYRGIVPMGPAREKLGAEHAENVTMLCGPGRAMFSYPLDGGESMNIVCLDVTRKTWEHEEWRRPCSREELQQLFKGWGSQAMAIIELLAAQPQLEAWAMHDHPPAPTLYKGRVALLGDSAHASTPYQGQGAAQALEDAVVLTTIFEHMTSAKQVVNAFAAYDQIRRPRSQRVVATSREAGDLLGMQLEGVGADLDLMKRESDSRYHWLWNRDQVAQGRAALELFQESLGSDSQAMLETNRKRKRDVQTQTNGSLNAHALDD